MGYLWWIVAVAVFEIAGGIGVGKLLKRRRLMGGTMTF